MPVPSPRNPILPARGNYADLSAGLASLEEGEIVYAIDQDKLYMKEGGVLVEVSGGGTLGSLNDVDVSSKVSGDVLSYNGTEWVAAGSPPPDLSLSGIGDLGDVDTTTTAPTDGQVMTWDSSNNEWRPADSVGGGSIDNLSDVDTTTVLPMTGQALAWDADDALWKPTTIAGGSGGSADVIGLAAWATVDDTGTILANSNIASCVRSGPFNETYTYTFTNPMPNDDYAVVVNENVASGLGDNVVFKVYEKTANGFNVGGLRVSGGAWVASSGAHSLQVVATNSLPPRGTTGADGWAAVTAAGAVEASYNIATCSKVGTGIYDYTFTTSLPTADYAVVATAGGFSSPEQRSCSVYNKTTGSFQIRVTYANIAGGNWPGIDTDHQVVIHATNASLPTTVTQAQLDRVVALPGRNILINGDVSINQRGVAYAAASVGDYWADRWKKTAAGMTQIVEEGNYRPSTAYTLSGTGVTTATATSPTLGDWDISVTFGDVIPGTATNIQLEEGAEATPFEIKRRDQELVACQRYYEVNDTADRLYSSYPAGSNVTVSYSYVWKTTKRITPTVTVGFAVGFTSNTINTQGAYWTRVGPPASSYVIGPITADAEL